LREGSDGDLLREMIGYVAQQLMKVHAHGLIRAAQGECSENRENIARRLL
jgi:hypothetical protein